MTQPGTPVLHPNYLKVFVQRDYSDGTSVKFQTRFPAELEGRVCLLQFSMQFSCSLRVHSLCTCRSPFEQIERHVFEATISRLNEYFAEAEKGSCSTYCEGCLACITAYLVYMCSETHYEKVIGLLPNQSLETHSIILSAIYARYCERFPNTWPLKMNASTIQRVFSSPIPRIVDYAL